MRSHHLVLPSLKNQPLLNLDFFVFLFFIFYFVFDKQVTVAEGFTRFAHMTRVNLSVVHVSLIWEVTNPAGLHVLDALWWIMRPNVLQTSSSHLSGCRKRASVVSRTSVNGVIVRVVENSAVDGKRLLSWGDTSQSTSQRSAPLHIMVASLFKSLSWFLWLAPFIQSFGLGEFCYVSITTRIVQGRNGRPGSHGQLEAIPAVIGQKQGTTPAEQMLVLSFNGTVRSNDTLWFNTGNAESVRSFLPSNKYRGSVWLIRLREATLSTTQRGLSSSAMTFITLTLILWAF